MGPKHLLHTYVKTTDNYETENTGGIMGNNTFEEQ